MKHDIFISYRRDGGFEIANLIASKLKIAGYRVFLDIHAMHAGDFSSQLEDKVKRCKDFIWILSANSESKTLYYKNGIDYYRDELCWAIEHKRNIIPVKLDGFTFPEVLPDCISEAIHTYYPKLDIYKLQAVEANKNQYFDAAIAELRKYLVSRPTILYKWVAIVISTIIAVSIILSSFLNNNSEQTCVIKFIEEQHCLPFDGADIELFVGSKSLGKKHIYHIDDEIVYTNIPRRLFSNSIFVKFSGNGYTTIDDTMKLEESLMIPVHRDSSYAYYYGYIYDSEYKTPIKGVDVVVADNYSQKTNEQGYFKIFVPLVDQRESLSLKAYKDGYKTFTDSETYPGLSQFYLYKNK